MRFAKTVSIADHATLELALKTLPRGQWINYDGAIGRIVGQGHTNWVAWGRTARDPQRFAFMCDAFRHAPKP